MKKLRLLCHVAAISLLLLLHVTSARRDPRNAGKMSFKAPILDEEGQASQHVPSKLICEGCKAIVYQINKQLWRFHKNKYPKNQIKPESDVIMAVEGICTTDTFNGYGAKNVDGATKLSGPGLKADGSAGMIQGGGRWPHRLGKRCGELMGEYDEYEIYKMIVNSRGKESKLFDLFCTNENNRKLNSCGDGMDTLLDPTFWIDEDGKHTNVKDAKKNKPDDDDDDYEDDDDYNDEL